jgi:hypothetical protein
MVKEFGLRFRLNVSADPWVIYHAKCESIRRYPVWGGRREPDGKPILFYYPWCDTCGEEFPRELKDFLKRMFPIWQLRAELSPWDE